MTRIKCFLISQTSIHQIKLSMSIHLNKQVRGVFRTQSNICNALHKKWSFSSRIFSVIVTLNGKLHFFFSMVYLFCENCYRLKAANYFRKNDIVKNDDRLGSKYASVSDLNIFLNRCNTQLKNVSWDCTSRAANTRR